MNSSVRAYRDSDRASVMSLVDRFTSFDLPPWRDKQTVDDANRNALSAALDALHAGRAVFVAERNNTFAGFVHVCVKSDHFTHEDIGYVSDIVVHPDFEGVGVAGELLDATLQWAQELDLKVLTLEVFDGNTRAMRLYEKHGYARDVVQYTRPVD
ncbi:MAG: GNAT family N-acetyltransferase [Actinobacteria bacterium]|nr:MAG: GNAT family N-acetyltransferase [Actinomycetota bacterium]